jgi:hypothetical protein
MMLFIKRTKERRELLFANQKHWHCLLNNKKRNEAQRIETIVAYLLIDQLPLILLKLATEQLQLGEQTRSFCVLIVRVFHATSKATVCSIIFLSQTSNITL